MSVSLCRAGLRARRATRRWRLACALAGAVAFTCSFESTVSAHRLDEYLQAARVSLSRDTVRLDLSLAPGAAVAPGIVALIDADGDGQISTAEATAYAARALQSMTLSLDGHELRLRLVSTESMTPASLLAGEGFVRVRAEANVGVPVQVGPHELRFENGFEPRTSVYLGNAMLPEDRTIAITDQDHGTNQSTLAVRYALRAEAPVGRRWVWLVGTAIVIAVGLWRGLRFARARSVNRPEASDASREERALDEPIGARGNHGGRSGDDEGTSN